MKAWIFQDHRQKKKHGDKAAWYVGWIDPEGRRKSERVGSKSMAEKVRRKKEAQLVEQTYFGNNRKPWDEFRSEYVGKIGPRLDPRTLDIVQDCLNHFERLAGPKRVGAITTQDIDAYVAKRRTERGKKKGDTVSPTTINKELRHLKAVLRVAHDWKNLPDVPKVRMVKEPKKRPRYMTPEHFAAIYGACDAARLPKGLACDPADWWRALIVFTYMTGWRVSEPTAVKREDLDLDAGTALTRHDDNKGDRDDLVHLHPVVVEHLRKIASFEPLVFAWPHNTKTLGAEFGRIQRAAKIHLPCAGKPEHTPACHVYGFHDLRRAFATMNADRLTADALQALMRHKSYLTTKRYIDIARQLDSAVESLHVPDVLRKAN